MTANLPHRLTKRLTAARLAGVPALEAAFVDPSGISDISDGLEEGGPGRQAVGPHVALLQQSLLAMGYDLPEFGADGIYGDETKHAVLRLQVDAGHPLHAGDVWEHVGGIAGCNSMVHFDMFDPGGTVGSHQAKATGISAQTLIFKESPDQMFAGVDESTTPVSVMVGLNTRRRVRIEIEPANADVTFAPVDPGIVTVGRTAEGIVVGGDAVGATSVEARSGGKVIARLAVNVKPIRIEAVNFFLVSDPDGSKASTEVDDEKAMLLTLRLNRVWRRQANVMFRLNDVERIRISGPDLQPGSPAREQLDARVSDGAFNVLCVGGGAAGDCDTDENLFVRMDRGCDDGLDIAHSAGHYLGLSGRHPADGVMAKCAANIERRRVSAEVADAVNPHV